MAKLTNHNPVVHPDSPTDTINRVSRMLQYLHAVSYSDEEWAASKEEQYGLCLIYSVMRHALEYESERLHNAWSNPCLKKEAGVSS